MTTEATASTLRRYHFWISEIAKAKTSSNGRFFTSNYFSSLIMIERIIQCKLEINRTIYYCGMHSHVSVIHSKKRVYLHEMIVSNCKRIYETGTIDLGSRDGYIAGLKSNSISTRSITLAGNTSMDGHCSGIQYNDPYGTWDSVVQVTIKVTLKNFETSIRRSSDEIILSSVLHCKLAAVISVITMSYTKEKPASKEPIKPCLQSTRLPRERSLSC